MKISQKGLYALQAVMMLARHHQNGPIKVRDIAQEEDLPAKFLELILIELKHARILDSERGSSGGYKLRREPSDIKISEVIRLLDGPLSPFGDADHLRTLIAQDSHNRALYQVFLDVRDSAANILENTTIADLIGKKPHPVRLASKKASHAFAGR